MKETSPNSSSRFHLRGVGKQTAKHLARLNIHSVTDLLFHLPLRYQDRTTISPIRQLKPDMEAVIEGVIIQATVPPRGKTKLLIELQDETGVIYLRFFHVFPFQKNMLTATTRLRCFGEIKLGQQGFEIFHPEFQVIKPKQNLPVDTALTPIYPTTEGLGQLTFRKLTNNALALLDNSELFSELLPNDILQKLSFPTIKDAFRIIHRPNKDIALTDLFAHKTHAQKRLIFEELLAHRLSLLTIKREFKNQHSFALTNQDNLSKKFIASLPFQLTDAQKRVAEEIKLDLEKPNPMLRLVQGDVGSGKTVIAALAMLQAVENHYQAAMMAPTELLAEQHYRVFKRWLSPLGVKVVYLAGNVKSSERTTVFESIQSDADIILGTHALFQEKVNFSKLALVIVDEQHRFGVHQRALFREKGGNSGAHPHQLIMTATPIPRTLAMSFYADLDCSLIDELPPGRTPIVTSVLANLRREEVIMRVREACQQGRQAYWVCPLINESEMLNCQSAVQTAEILKQSLPNLTVGLIHGRMTSPEKESVMHAFQQGNIHLLVATTVIEVGVDVPNASLMIIENAERLGLSQLHQLRGRVGRGNIASHCVLLYESPLSEMAKERLTVMRETTDGFKIAQRDLELRGPGEVLGIKQTGELTFRIVDLLRDNHLLSDVHHAADIIIKNFPDKINPLVDRWLSKKIAYGNV